MIVGFISECPVCGEKVKEELEEHYLKKRKGIYFIPQGFCIKCGIPISIKLIRKD